MYGGAQRPALEDDGEQQDADGDRQALDLVRVAQLLDALVEGEQAAHREQHEGDDEGPEVALAAVAERMVGVGGLASARLPPSSSSAWLPVSASEWTASASRLGRAGDEEPDELGDGDAEVGEERGE